ncbi:tumor necrosis factor ligand superfamily member 10 isoform X2 [Hypomesus transpacificus]|uniref:tumor necrosis factor ligand superfamily member 10 isoform X2 n=1 Tax=Hypomesus transpacificus TaxID=137520 RepID=UPI001F071F7A|nr:tumor necrosis factor ligand superfamily member 10 isoform X2 [Hypomesus transpacificus]
MTACSGGPAFSSLSVLARERTALQGGTQVRTLLLYCSGFGAERDARQSVGMTGSSGVPCLGILLLVAVLLQTVAVTVTVLYFTNVLNSMKETFARGSVSCLTRANLRGAYLRAAEEGRGDPCWQVTQQLHSLIEKSLSQRYQSEISTAVKDEVSRVLPSLVMEDIASPRPKVAAHVTGSYASTVEMEEGVSAIRRIQGQKITWWEGQKGLAFLRDIRLVDGELVVPRPGLYYVYAQTYFRHSHPQEEEGEEGEDEDRGRPMLQYVYKKVTSYVVPILLMKTSRTPCWSRVSQFSLHSAHQGGLFPLTAGDRLFVTVSNASAVDMDERSSFFGAFLLS